MKKLFLITLLVPLFINATNFEKKEKNNDEITLLEVNLNDLTNTIEETLSNGNYKLKIFGKFDKTKYYINIKKKETIIDREPIDVEGNLKTTTEGAETDFIFNKTYDFEIKNRTRFEVTAQIMDAKTNKLVREVKIIYTSIQQKKWVSSVGVASNFLFNSDTYRTVKNGDKFNIERDGSQEILQVIPLVQFSFIDLEKDCGFAPTGGIGFDTENISAFVGYSYYFGQNVFITGGVSLHKQKRLNNLYKVGDELDEPIDETILNKGYYRFNPFLSFTYRISSNVFKK